MPDPLRVLYVDDEPGLLEIGKLFLEESRDFSVTTIDSAAAALSLISKEKFDAIVSDYQMPGMDGIQFLIEVRSRFGPIPFILFTGRGREEVVIQALNSGADFYLQKGGEPASQFVELSHKIKQATYRKRAEDSFRKSEEKYRQLIENSAEGIIVSQDGMLRLVNHRTIEFTGYSEQELLSMSIFSFIHPDDRAMVMERYKKRMNGEKSSSRYTVRLIPRDGSTSWVEISTVIIDWDGRPAMMNFLTDITERKRADDSLREEQKFSKLILDSLPGIFYLYTYPENRMVRWNKQHETLLGYTAEEIKGKLGTDLHLPEHKDAVLKAIDEVMEKGQSSVESTLLAKDGHLIPFFFTGVRFEAPGQLYFMGIGIDITERKRAEEELLRKNEELNASYEEITATEEELRNNLDELARQEQALRKSEASLREILDATPFPVALVDLQDNNIEFWSRSAITLFGHTAPTAPEWYQLAYPDPDYQRDAIERWKPYLEEAKQSGQPVNTGEYRVTCRDGTVRICELYAAFLPDKLIVTFNDVTERKVALAALTENEERLRTTLEILPVGIFIFSKNGQILTANAMVNRIWGVTEGVVPHSSEMQEFVEYKGWWPDTGVALRPEDWAASRVLLKGETAPVDIVNIQRFEGSFGTIIVSAVPIHDDGGNINGAVAVIQDITERKLVEEALRESEEKYRALFAAESDGIFVVDKETGIIIDCNDSITPMYGYRKDEVIGQPNTVMSAEPDETRAATREVKGLIPVRCHKRKDGSIFPVEITANVVTVKGHDVIVAAVRDITERKQAEDALRESEEHLRTIILSTQFGIVIIDAQTHTILEANDKALEMLGSSNSVIVGSVCHRFICPAELGKCPVTDLGQNVDSSERVLLNLRGEKVPIIKSVIRTTLGGKDVLIESFIDITARKKAEEALALASKKLKLLSGITRHDINNQITVLRGYLTILEQKQRDPTLTEYFGKVSTAAQRISAMIRFTKEYEEIGVNAPAWQRCHTLVETAAVEIQLGEITVVNDLPSGSEVFADPMIVKVFYNLMDNAVRYGEKITTIGFSAQERNENFVIVCEDDGDGVPHDEKEKIFERGFGKNTGLGLFLSREILDITGITITETGEPGKGARFEIVVPKGTWRMNVHTDLGKMSLT